MSRIAALLALPLAAVLTLPAAAQDGEWHTSLSAGKKAAKQSGKAILYITSWKPNV